MIYETIKDNITTATLEDLKTHYKTVRRRMLANAIKPPPVKPIPPKPTSVIFVEPAINTPTIWSTYTAPDPVPLFDDEIVTMERVLHAIAKTALVNPRTIRSRDRHVNTCKLRHVFYFMAREDCTNFHSYPAIGKFIGVDHSTVLHGYRKVASRIKDYKAFILEVRKLLPERTG